MSDELPSVRPLATEDELSAYLRTPKGTLRNWRYRKVGPKWLRLEGGGIRYDWADVEAWAASQRQGDGT